MCQAMLKHEYVYAYAAVDVCTGAIAASRNHHAAVFLGRCFAFAITLAMLAGVTRQLIPFPNPPYTEEISGDLTTHLY